MYIQKKKDYKNIKVKFVYSLKGTRFPENVPTGMPPKPVFGENNVIIFGNTTLKTYMTDIFNENRPKTMGIISLYDVKDENNDSPENNKNNVVDSPENNKNNVVNSFDILDYEGKKIKIGKIEENKILMFSDIEGCQNDNELKH